jgi:hypothetical protein
MLRASVYNPGTPMLCKVTASERIIDTPGPKWKYTLRPVGLEFDDPDVLPYEPETLEATTLTGYNVHELKNTTSTWFGLASSEYKGLEFNPCPNDHAVLGFMIPFAMVDSAGAPDTDAPDAVALFHWPNQLSGDCD